MMVVSIWGGHRLFHRPVLKHLWHTSDGWVFSLNLEVSPKPIVRSCACHCGHRSTVSQATPPASEYLAHGSRFRTPDFLVIVRIFGLVFFSYSRTVLQPDGLPSAILKSLFLFSSFFLKLHYYRGRWAIAMNSTQVIKVINNFFIKRKIKLNTRSFTVLYFNDKFIFVSDLALAFCSERSFSERKANCESITVLNKFTASASCSNALLNIKT